MLVQTPNNEKYQVADGYHRLKARQKLGHVAINAYVGKVEDDEGPWQKEMHDKKLNRAQQWAIINRSSGAWHNSDGASPDAEPEEMAAHLYSDHNMPELAHNWHDFTPAELDKLHADDHNEHGECGAHERGKSERSVAQDNAAYQEGQADRKAKQRKLTQAEFVKEHPDHDADDYPLYEAGYLADKDDTSLELVERRDAAGDAAAQEVDKVNRAAYYEGVADERGGKPKKSPVDYAHAHPTHDKDDYAHYSQGYEDGKLPGRRGTTWLPLESNDIIHCAQCGQPATSYSEDANGGRTGMCSSHFDVATGADSVRAMEIQGVPLMEWLKANETGLLALAEAEEEDEPKSA